MQWGYIRANGFLGLHQIVQLWAYTGYEELSIWVGSGVASEDKGRADFGGKVVCKCAEFKQEIGAGFGGRALCQCTALYMHQLSYLVSLKRCEASC
jgi:hypothetical protein